MIHERPKNEIFASDAKVGEIVEFPNVKRGWGVTENLGFIPPMEYFNAAFNRVDKSLAYQLQRGVSEWSAEEEYPAGAVSVFNSKLYQAKATNTNKKPPDNKDAWDAIASETWSEQTFLKKTATAADSEKLGGLAADKYAKKDDIPQAATETKAGIVKLKNSITGSLADTAVSEKAAKEYTDKNASIGIGQTWQEVTSERHTGVTYTNTTGRPIFISVYMNSNSQGGASIVEIYVDGKLIGGQYAGRMSGITVYLSACAVVPPGSTYSAKTSRTLDGSYQDASKWLELR